MGYNFFVEYWIEIVFFNIFELLFVYMLRSDHDEFRC